MKAAVMPGTETQRWIDRKWVVCLLLFGVTGVWGLPFLWISRGFSSLAKIGLSVAVTLYTFALVGLTATCCYWAWHQLLQLLS
jgi:hypothetical protein